MAYVLRSARYIAADVLSRVIRPGDAVIDATLGNGHDTVMLARLVGETGRVIGFDIQPEAVERTAARLQEEHLLERCELYAEGHQHIAERVHVPVRAAVFNLGWLPGGDKSITTLWETTRVAIDAALHLLEPGKDGNPGGVCTICAYPGHAEGDRERFALTDWLTALRPQEYNVLHHRFLNAGPGAPECFVIQKQ